jgi:hypothetical protein
MNVHSLSNNRFPEHAIPLVWGAQAASLSFSAALPKSSSGQSILRALL